jgi:hypothetical protein
MEDQPVEGQMWPMPNVPNVPDYTQASDRQLRRAQAVELTRLITADIGHIFLKGIAFAQQLVAIFDGTAFTFDWDPDVTGVHADLDDKERRATEHLHAIWREMSLRRSVRQRLHERTENET